MIPVFSILFAAGVIGIFMVVTRKVPLVLATPKQVVNDYMEQESARIHVRMLRIKRWFREGEYWDPILFILIRMMRTFRIFVLKLDRWTFVAVQTLNERYEIHKSGEEKQESAPEVLTEAPSAPEFWSELKSKDSEGTKLSV